MLPLIGFALFAVLFLWLLMTAARNAWTAEQEWKTQEAAWTAAHPESQPRTTRKIANIAGIVAALLVVAWLTSQGVNIVPACALVALPVLVMRQLRRRSH